MNLPGIFRDVIRILTFQTTHLPTRRELPHREEPVVEPRQPSRRTRRGDHDQS